MNKSNLKISEKLFIYCDGGARGNPGPAASAFIVKNLAGEIVFRQGVYIGVATNNQAEYHAVINALEWIGQTTPKSETVFFLDSLLVVNQIKGEYKIKEPGLQEKARQVAEKIQHYNIKIRNYIYVPRNVNYEADALVNQTLDINIL